MKTDLHYKLISFLCKRYKNIILPKYRTSQMKNNWTSSVKRSSDSLGHYQFEQRLKWKCFLHGTKLYEPSEAYTTIVCCSCGARNKANDRNYNCNKCGIDIEREYNSSVCITIKSLLG